MAKLNVKVLDMQNGEITKVAYEGAEYAKVEGKAEVGDIVINNRIHRDLTKGGYYSVIRVYDTESIRVTDDASDGHDIRKSLIDGPFRKISAQSKPTLEQRVGALESDVAALKSSDSSLKGEKVAEEPKRLAVGDTAKVISRSLGMNGKVGDVVKIVKDDKSKWPYECVRVSDQVPLGWFYERELEAYAEETIEFEGATYRKVEREAREGDVVIFRANKSRYLANNKPYKAVFEDGVVSVLDCEDEYLPVYKEVINRTRETVDVYEAQYVPQEGDIVVITGNTNSSNNKVGDIGKITVVDDDDQARVQVSNRPTFGNWTKFEDMRKAAPAEVEKYEQAVKDAEIAEKWAKIGRKPNEFKKGDVLSYKYGSEPICYYKVTRIDGDKVYYDCHEFGNDEEFSWKDGDGIQLVAPVESLFINA